MPFTTLRLGLRPSFSHHLFCVHYSLTSTLNDRFLRNFFMADLFALKGFGRNPLRGNRQRNIFFIFRFDAWTGIQALCLMLLLTLLTRLEIMLSKSMRSRWYTQGYGSFMDDFYFYCSLTSFYAKFYEEYGKLLTIFNIKS